MSDFRSPIIRLAQAYDAYELKKLKDLFNDSDDTTLHELGKSLIDNQQEIAICADMGTMIIGVCCVQIIRTMCYNWQYSYITELFVREEYRNRGIGKLMMKFAEQELGRQGIKKCFLIVGKANEKAQRLYLSLGFNVISEKMYMKEN